MNYKCLINKNMFYFRDKFKLYQTRRDFEVLWSIWIWVSKNVKPSCFWGQACSILYYNISYWHLVTREMFLSFFNLVSYKAWIAYLRLEYHYISMIRHWISIRTHYQANSSFWKGMCLVVLSKPSAKPQKQYLLLLPFACSFPFSW